MDDTSLDTGLKDTNSYSDNINIFVFFHLFGFYSFGEFAFIQFVVTCIIICLGLPLTLGVIYGLCSQVRNGEAAPIYVINLLISDLIQFVCMIAEVALSKDPMGVLENSGIIWVYIYIYSLMVSVGFMVCISLERYLVIVHPLWYRCRRTIKTSVMICVTVWILPLACVLTEHFFYGLNVKAILYTTFFLLPLPLLLFFTVATLKALSASISVSTDEKRRIAGMLILVQLIYLLLFLPGIILYMLFMYGGNNSNADLILLFDLAPMFLKLSPLADLLLYIILRKGTVRQLSACVCRCRKQSNETNLVPV